MKTKSLLFHLTYMLTAIGSLAVSCDQAETRSTNPDLPDPLEAGWNGKKVCEVLEENDQLRILKCTFPPGVGHEKHYHPPHVGYTLKGGKFSISDSTGTREVNVPTGYTFSNEQIVMHEVLNIGSDTSQYLIIEYK
jgi:quercetin dioxygenase-like cupin family protein